MEYPLLIIMYCCQCFSRTKCSVHYVWTKWRQNVSPNYLPVLIGAASIACSTICALKSLNPESLSHVRSAQNLCIQMVRQIFSSHLSQLSFDLSDFLSISLSTCWFRPTVTKLHLIISSLNWKSRLKFYFYIRLNIEDTVQPLVSYNFTVDMLPILFMARWYTMV